MAMFRHLSVSLLVILLLLCDPSQQEAFSSMETLVQLVQSEPRFLAILERHLERERERLNDMQTIVDTVKKNPISRSTGNDVLGYIGHPLNAYSVIKFWTQLMERTSNAGITDQLQEEMGQEGIRPPTENDRKGALQGVLRVQRVYNISTDDMADGWVYGRKSSPVQAEDMYELGDAAVFNEEWNYCVQWKQAALERGLTSQPRPQVLLEIAQCHYRLGDYHAATLLAEQAAQLDAQNATLAETYWEYRNMNDSMSKTNYQAPTAATWQKQEPDWKENYMRLCRGDARALDTSNSHKLRCWYRPSYIPYAPTKEEILSYNPRISLLYDVLFDHEAAKLQEMAAPGLFRATVGDPAKTWSTSERVAKVNWIWDEHGDDPELIRRLSKRVERVTGLQTTYRNPFSSSEPFQVVNYGIGGQYEPHVDYYEEVAHLKNVPDFIQNTGDRICTFMFYVNNVTAGGATVFPKVKVRVPPVKNAAAFWYNARRSGEYDPLSQHAGCPVVLGQKWVANKWVREYGQEFRRRCGKTFEEADTLTDRQGPRGR